MYESPIVLNYADPIIEKIKTETEDYIFKGIVKCGLSIDKEELIKALQYDRDQYEKGYADGFWAGYTEAKEKYMDKLTKFIQGALENE